jgi:ADP-ribose pyrophosphatase YjhB (NUDIX family)
VIIDATGRRIFAAYPVAVQAIIINEQEEILLLSSPTRNLDGAWQTVSGALDAGETVLGGTLREVKEELGKAIRVRPLGVVHVESFHYDNQVRFMIAIYYLFAYEGGSILPGDDMAGSDFRWWSLSGLSEGNIKIHVPPDGLWLFQRSVDAYRLWNKEDVRLQPSIT